MSTDRLSSLKSLIVKDLGLSRYREAWELQQRLQHNLIQSISGTGAEYCTDICEYLLLTEHYPVYTLGRHGHPENMLLSADALRSRGVELIQIERGGDITYHGPGQLVAYPIISLLRHHLGVKDYVNLLEEAVIRTIDRYGLTGERVAGATGVWLGKGTYHERKICAIGVKCTRFVTMHGLALNVNTDLRSFSAINPCGFVDKGVCSIASELGHEVDMRDVKRIFADCFVSLML